ncbi:MAG: hypothetical protein ACUZ8H_13905, partial [Candidatus Anammoxibacter sp.]
MNDPIIKLRERLLDIAARNNEVALSDLLEGVNLPVFGGGEQPAETIFAALSTPSFDRKSGSVIAKLLAKLVADQNVCFKEFCNGFKAISDKSDDSSIADREQSGTYGDKLFLFNLLLLSSNLQPDDDLFDSLKSFYGTFSRSEQFEQGFDEITGQLRQALIYQQTDCSFEQEWFNYLKDSKPDGSGKNSSTCGKLLDAWLGLLWLPHNQNEGDDSSSINMERIDHGLRALCDAASHVDDAQSILRYAVRTLRDSFPASPDLWVKRFSPYFDSYQQILKDATVDRIPSLSRNKIALILPSSLKETWNALPASKRDEFNKSVQDDSTVWESLWQDIIFNPVLKPDNYLPQEWNNKLAAIKKHAEKTFLTISDQAEDL